VAPPVFKTGLAANTVAGGFDSLPPPPQTGCVSHKNWAFLCLEWLGRIQRICRQAC